MTTRCAPVRLWWSDSHLTISPMMPGLKKLLTLRQRSLRNERGISSITHEEVPMYWDMPGHDELGLPCNVMCTYAGFLDKVVRWLLLCGIPYQLQDGRLPFPDPDLGAMHGFRFNQKEVVTKFLSMKRSGLLGAPTRWGKTAAIANTLKAYKGLKTILVAPGTDLLLHNLRPDLKKWLPDREIKVLCTGSKDKTQSEDITLVSVDSLAKCCATSTRLVLVDEPHALPTEGRLEDFTRFVNARKLGFGATLDGRFDKRDPLIEGAIGPPLVVTTYKECRDIGAVAHLEIFMLRYQHAGFRCRDRNKAYERLMWQNERLYQHLDNVLKPEGGCFPPQWQLLMFINNEKQVECMQRTMKTPFEVAMAKLMTKKQREESMAHLKDGTTRACAATNIYAQGVTFSDLMVVVNLNGGGASTQNIQKPGRVLEVRPGKKCGIMLDMFFCPNDDTDLSRDRSPCWDPARESRTRAAYYAKVGFNVTMVNSPAHLAQLVKERCVP